MLISKLVFPIKAPLNHVLQYLLTNVIVLTIYNYDPNFMEQLYQESVFFSTFDGNCMSYSLKSIILSQILLKKLYQESACSTFGGNLCPSLKLVFWQPFCNGISEFHFCCLIILDYFISGAHFSAKVIQDSTFLS